jgi:hypothetical protein
MKRVGPVVVPGPPVVQCPGALASAPGVEALLRLDGAQQVGVEAQ